MSEEPENDPRRSRLQRFRRVGISILSIYLMVIVFLLIFEPVLIYPVLIMGGQQSSRAPESSDGSLEEGFVKAADGIQVHYAHFRPDSAKQNSGVILFCHGNAEWVSRLHGFMVALGNTYQISVVVFDYRGYGQSEGLPYEPGILKDADAMYEWVREQGYPADKIIVFGKSLGGGPACYIASRYPIGGLVLQNTFSSLVDVAAYKFWWLPVRFMMRNRFNSADRLKDYNGPLLQTHGTNDNVVAYHLGQRLFESAESGNKKFLTHEGGGHNDPMTPAFGLELREFIVAIQSAKP